MGTLVGKLHDERREVLPKGRELPCLLRPRCKGKRKSCERACGGYVPDLRGRR